MVMDVKGDLVTDCHRILDSYRNQFSQLLNVHWAYDVRQTEIHTAEPQVLQPSTFEFESAIDKLRSHKILDTNQIPSK
jgi:hypothetical protein